MTYKSKLQFQAFYPKSKHFLNIENIQTEVFWKIPSTCKNPESIKPHLTPLKMLITRGVTISILDQKSIKINFQHQ